MKVQEISDIFEHNLGVLDKAEIKPARFRDYDNKELWDSHHQRQMESLLGHGRVLGEFSGELYKLYGRLCAVHGEEKLKVYEPCVTLATRFAEQFTRGEDQLNAWRTDETGFWKRQQLRLSKQARAEEEKKTLEQVRKMIKMPACFAAYLAMVSRGDEFLEMLREHHISLVSYTDYLDVICPHPFAGLSGDAPRHQRGVIIPTVNAYDAAEALREFGQELYRRIELKAQTKAYGIELAFTHI